MFLHNSPPRFKVFRERSKEQFPMFSRERSDSLLRGRQLYVRLSLSLSLSFHSHVSPFSFARAYSHFLQIHASKDPYVQKRYNDLFAIILLLHLYLFCKYSKTYIFVYCPSALQAFYWFLEIKLVSAYEQ